MEIGGRSFVLNSDMQNDTWTLTAPVKIPDGPHILYRSTSQTTFTCTPEENTIYLCSTLTSLTISNPPAMGSYSIVFTSGSTATSTTFPNTILGLENFAAEANTIYEINVFDNRAVVGSWAVSA